jgi:hypothetical protein
MGLTQAAVHHGTNAQSKKTADANKQISGRYYQSVDSQESNHPCVEQEFQGDIGVYEQINAENQAKDVQAESIFADSSEIMIHPCFLDKNYQVNALMIMTESIQLKRQLMQMVILC